MFMHARSQHEYCSKQFCFDLCSFLPTDKSIDIKENWEEAVNQLTLTAVSIV